jgi:hypothetical protein
VSGLRAAPAVDPDAARRQAQHILSDRRYRSASTPRPLRGPLHWIGERLNDLLRPIGNFFARLPGEVWISIALGLVALVIWLAVKSYRRRIATTATRAARRATPDAPEDPDELERAADEAERDGDLERAVRLRFRAGLLRLGNRGAIHYRPSVTTGEVRRTLSSERFDGLAGTFEAVTYGGRETEQPDVAAARREWPQVLEETARK